MAALLLFAAAALIPASDATAATLGPSSREINFQVTPHTFSHGFTKQMTLNCSFHHGTDITSDLSMIVSKTDNFGDSVFHEIATVTSSSPQVTVKNSLGGQVTGQFSVDGISVITYQWQYPSAQVEGNYRCEAYGLDDLGHPRVSEGQVEVHEQDVDFSMLIDRIQKMDMTQMQLVDQLNKSKEEVEHLKLTLTQTMNQLNKSREEVDHLTVTQTQVVNQLNKSREEVDQLKLQLSQYVSTNNADINHLKSQLATLQSAVFTESSSYQSHSYWLSSPVRQNVTLAQSVCEAYGGYLVEINDEKEFNFVADFLHTFWNTTYSMSAYVLLGATDSGHEGKWTFLHSGSEMTYFKWRPGEPDVGVSSDCIVLNAGDQFMNDDPCIWKSKQVAYPRRFLCEIPVQ